MNKIITLSVPYRFCVYEHKIQSRRKLSTDRMIVLKNESGRIVHFTGLEQFSYPYTGQRPKITTRQKQELLYICNALNHILSANRISKIADITFDMVFRFFDFYCQTPILVHGGYVRKVIVSGLQFVKWFTGVIATSARKNVLLLTKHKNSLVPEIGTRESYCKNGHQIDKNTCISIIGLHGIFRLKLTKVAKKKFLLLSDRRSRLIQRNP